MTWRLAIDPKVRKQLRKIPLNYSKRILGVIEGLPLDPYTGDIEKMEGQDEIWRRRIGDYRIFYMLDRRERLVYVFKVKRRTSTTY
ncbi:type II toxin-antitoxin system RelE/ParE family toxin [Candidatus Berkelbacteria bacterium]|nr:type II toxin-antitoxin system RelE/ParE family toxin [Candidatus Berkelbacteria bacterium]